jgi:hypothetical protein
VSLRVASRSREALPGRTERPSDPAAWSMQRSAGSLGSGECLAAHGGDIHTRRAACSPLNSAHRFGEDRVCGLVVVLMLAAVPPIDVRWIVLATSYRLAALGWM